MNPTYVLKRIAALVAMLVVKPVRDLWRTLTARHPVRVFTFHRVSDLCRDPLTVSPTAFRRRVEYLQRSHDIVPLEEALRLIREGTPLRRPTAVLTFDDGYRNVYDHARPVLEDLGVVACCFVCTDLAGTERRFDHDAENPARPDLSVMSWGQIVELHQSGWSIGAHTATHARLSECAGEVLQYEVERPLVEIRERLQVQDVAMAFTFGGRSDTSEAAEALARRAGYTAYFSNWGGDNHAPTDPFLLQRIDIGGDLPTFVWKAWIHGFDFARLRWWGRNTAPKDQ